MEKDDKIVILGVTGYMGAWLAKTLIDQGYTNVLGTYRNHQKKDCLKKQLPSLIYVEADLLASPEKNVQVVAGSKWVFNDSAPFTGKEKTIDDFIHTKLAAVDHLFKAISVAGTVEKLVHIGSVAAVGFGNTDPEKRIITEADWTDLEHLDYPYERFVVMKTYVVPY